MECLFLCLIPGIPVDPLVKPEVKLLFTLNIDPSALLKKVDLYFCAECRSKVLFITWIGFEILRDRSVDHLYRYRLTTSLYFAGTARFLFQCLFLLRHQCGNLLTLKRTFEVGEYPSCGKESDIFEMRTFEKEGSFGKVCQKCSDLFFVITRTYLAAESFDHTVDILRRL